MRNAVSSCAIALALAGSAVCQQPSGPAPIYRVTVIQRTTKAINYQYRNGPTPIDFVGTALLPKGHGEAMVDSKEGRTEIDASFENLPDANRFGRGYLTYVLWALTPEGRPRNIGEVTPGHSDKAHLRVTTDLQAFAMIVTAEPYSAVRQPSAVVVLENQVRPDTIGTIEQVDAHYELLPRDHYTWSGPEAAPNTPMVSMREYQALSELYQAQNAVAVAQSSGAQKYAPDTFARAQALVAAAEQWEKGRQNPGRVVEQAREAAQTAEDARMIAEQKQREDQLAQDRAKVAEAQQAAQQAQAQAEQERAALDQANADAAAARARLAQLEQRTPAPPAPPEVRPQASPADLVTRKTELRMRMLREMNGALSTRDTPRGLVATVPDSEFRGALLRPGVATELMRLAAIVKAHPGLTVVVEGNTDSEATAAECSARAQTVRNSLIAQGLAPSMISARGMGNSHPLGPNTTAAGRELNRRVEIVVSGDTIGNLPSWDRTYSLSSR